MRKIFGLALPVMTFMAFIAFSGSAFAAKGRQVMIACDNTPNCGYSVGSNGSVSGCITPCSKKEGCCFHYAHAVTDCISVFKPGATSPVPGNVMDMMKPGASGAPGAPHVRPRGGIGGLTPPVGGVNPGGAR